MTRVDGAKQKFALPSKHGRTRGCQDTQSTHRMLRGAGHGHIPTTILQKANLPHAEMATTWPPWQLAPALIGPRSASPVKQEQQCEHSSSCHDLRMILQSIQINASTASAILEMNRGVAST